MKRRDKRGMRTLLLFSLLLCGSLHFAPAQSMGALPSITGETATPIPGVGHDYINLLNETVDPSSGTVNINIALPMPKSRGLTLPFSIRYSSAAAFQLNPVGNQLELMSFCGAPFGNPCGWNYGVPSAAYSFSDQSGGNKGDCYTANGYIFTDPTGVSHSFNRMGETWQDAPQTICYWSDAKELNGQVARAPNLHSATPVKNTALCPVHRALCDERAAASPWTGGRVAHPCFWDGWWSD